MFVVDAAGITAATFVQVVATGFPDRVLVMVDMGVDEDQSIGVGAAAGRHEIPGRFLLFCVCQ